MGMHQQFAWLFGSARRISDILLVLDELDAQTLAREREQHPREVAMPHRGQRACLVDATIVAPDGQLLAQDLSFSVEAGGQHNLLISGEAHGVGKSAVVRALYGLWPLSKGHVEWPDAGAVVVSQATLVPVLPISLLDYCTYPLQLGPGSSAEVKAIETLTSLMQQTRVYYLVERNTDGWHAVKAWDSELSKGEAQCLAIVRVLYHKPAIAVLDETTSAMAEGQSVECYRLLQQHGISFISVVQSGPRAEALGSFHSQKLSLDAKSIDCGYHDDGR